MTLSMLALGPMCGGMTFRITWLSSDAPISQHTPYPGC